MVVCSPQPTLPQLTLYHEQLCRLSRATPFKRLELTKAQWLSNLCCIPASAVLCVALQGPKPSLPPSASRRMSRMQTRRTSVQPSHDGGAFSSKPPKGVLLRSGTRSEARTNHTPDAKVCRDPH